MGSTDFVIITIGLTENVFWKRPFNDVLSSGKPDFPFCLCWLIEKLDKNMGWARKDILRVSLKYWWRKMTGSTSNYLLQAFQDERYIRIVVNHFFLVHRATKILILLRTTYIWRDEAQACVLEKFFFVE